MSAWGNIEKPELVNFADIVSEEISRHLQAKKESSILDASNDGWTWIESDECNEDLHCTEENINETSNLSHCDQNVPLINDSASSVYKEDILEDELTHSDEGVCSHKVRSSEEVINKYDIVLQGKKDDSKVPSLATNFRTEDGKMVDFKSFYRLFKSLKIYDREEEIDFINLRTKYGEVVMDPHIHILFYNMIASRFLQNVDYVIHSSAEGVILHGVLDPSYPNATKDWPTHCAIKVFKQVPRFKYNLSFIYKEGLVEEASTVQWWAQKAVDNLISAKKVGVLCPQVIKLKRLFLVTSFIGKGKKPAPKLKYACLCYTDFVAAYEQVKNAMKLMYEKANLIHGDVSEYNILWHSGQCYFIDFTHSVNPSYEYGYYYLHCDCINVTNYFGKRIPDIESAEDLFMDITGFCYTDKSLLQNMQNLYKENPNMLHKPSEVQTDGFDKEIIS